MTKPGTKIYRSTQTTEKQMKHGLSWRARRNLTNGLLPKGCLHIRRATEALRDQILEEVDRRGEVGLMEVAATHTAIRWERVALLAQRWLQKEFDQLTPEQRLQFAETTARASTNRDKVLRQLGLDRLPEMKTVDALYSYASEPEESTEAQPETPDGQ